VAHDLPSLVRFMLGTGCRLGEALGLRWCDVDLDAGLVTINGTLVPERGKGLGRHSGGKTAAAVRNVALPAFLVTMLQVRYDAETLPSEPVFASSRARWRHPAIVSSSLRKARDKAGYPWLTSHVFRKTAATILDDCRFSARQIADQLGHARPSLTQDVYMHRGAVSPAAAAELDDALRPRG
jgi:integrase